MSESGRRVALAATRGSTEVQNRIQVSNTKKPLFFYVNLANVLPVSSGFFTVITTVVTIAEILKNTELSTEKILMSTVGMKDENKGRFFQMAKTGIVLGKSEKFDSLMTALAPAPAVAAKDKD